MRHLDLFSGIGGFALAARWVGWETVQFVEIDPFCQAILKKNFPNVPIHGDIKTFNYTGTVDIITGGFPCQPFSVAGKQKGKDDNRHLWPELIKTIRRLRPAYVVCENVPGIIKLALEEVCTDLEAEDYSVETFIIPACGVGAIHKRDRVWIIAYSNSGIQSAFRGDVSQVSSLPKEERESEYSTSLSGGDSIEIISNPGFRRHELQEGEIQTRRNKPIDCSAWPTEPPVCGTDARIPNRVDRIKSLGNSIVPQIPFEIFKAINSLHEEN